VSKELKLLETPKAQSTSMVEEIQKQ